MQWGQIKTLFILCFLIVDIFLLQQFLNSRDTEVIQEETADLMADIGGVDKLSDEIIQEPFLYAKQKVLSEKDKQNLEGFENQEIAVIDDSIIVSMLEEPVPLDMEDKESYQATLVDNILYGDQYVYWDNDELSNTLVFFQTMGDKPIYYSTNAFLLIMVNEKGEMVSYLQTMLEKETDNSQEPANLMPQLEAVSYLYYRTTYLSHGDEITGVNLGLHSLTALPNGGQVLAPTWNVIVNDERNYFIQAIEAIEYPRNDASYLKSIINETLEHINEVDSSDEDSDEDSVEFINTIKARLTEILNQQVGVGKHDITF